MSKPVDKVVPSGYKSIAGFHSKSPNADYRYLSNFQAIPSGLTFTVDLTTRNVMRLQSKDLSVIIRVPETYTTLPPMQVTVISVERAFQALKYLFVLNKSSDKRQTLFQHAIGVIPSDTENVIAFAGIDSKRIGAKTAFKSAHLVLDIDTWNSVKHDVMEFLVRMRYNEDEKFRHIIIEAERSGVYLYHVIARKRIFDPKTGEYIRGSDSLGDLVRSLPHQKSMVEMVKKEVSEIVYVNKEAFYQPS